MMQHEIIQRPNRSTALWSALLIGVILILLYGQGWYGLELIRISKETELATHLADLGRLAQPELKDAALAMSDLALDVRWSVETGEQIPLPAVAPTTDSLSQTPSELQELYRDNLRESKTLPFDRFVRQARLLRVVLLSEEGLVLYDTEQLSPLLDAFEFWRIDAPEIQQALLGESAASPAYRVGDTPVKRHYVPIMDLYAEDENSQPPVRAILCLVAGRDYLGQIDRLASRFFHLNALVTVLMLLIGWIIYRLIRRQQRVERQFERQMAESERLAGLGSLAAGFAHELRNPLEIIRAFTEDLDHSLRNDSALDEAQESCREIIEEVDRMNHLVGQFLRFTREEGTPGDPTTQDDPPPMPTNLFPELQSVLTMLRPTAGKTHVTIDVTPTLDGCEEPPAVRVGLASGPLRQILENLVLNAVQASPDGGGVRVQWRETARQVELRVCDDGPGIPEAIAHRIFEPFFTTRSSGSGLGLSISQRIAEKAGGSLAIDPRGRDDQGACFLLTLPRADERTSTSESPTPKYLEKI